jgi:co-chaperonin GroES (HSP10)
MADTGLPDRSFEPLGNLVILKMIPVDKSPGGVVIPESLRDGERAGEEARKGWVVSAGAQCRYVRRGDLVLVQGNVFTFKHNGLRLQCIKEDQIVGIECNNERRIPEFEVRDWDAGEVERTDP